ncbi:MAG: D-hexose-6-phosphate mutarotase [Methylophilaceae bacterium]|nr:D-hexose-6-phosphate mutarotase [Methylophilaceae bacterium]
MATSQVVLKEDDMEFTSSHSAEDDVRFTKGESGLDYIEIENRFATAKLALQGAHLMYWHPKHTEQPVLWVSEESRYEAGRSIRGGIPLCWPWFGAHPTDSSLCMHGFARVTPFTVIDIGQMNNGYTRVILQMKQTENAQRQLSYPYTLVITLEIGETLSIKLSTTNRATQPFFMGEAFHTYFHVSDVEKVRVSGLDNTEYADKLLDYWRDTQVGDITFNQEFDRVYVSTKAPVTIHDPQFKRNIVINKKGSNSTVVWTPWQKKAHQMADMPKDDSWRRMLCVETANAMENLVMINPGYTHVLAVEYVVEKA